jgi:hypothetical protein
MQKMVTTRGLVCVVVFRPTPQLFPFVNRHGHDGNKLEILKYLVSVPKVPGTYHGKSLRSLSPPSIVNHQGLFPHYQPSIETLVGNYLKQMSAWQI